MSVLYSTQKESVDLPRQLEGLEKEFIEKLTGLLGVFGPQKEKVLDYLALRLDWLKSQSRRQGQSIDDIALNNAELQGKIDEVEKLLTIIADPEKEAGRIKAEGV